jgi:hypothetical protein
MIPLSYNYALQAKVWKTPFLKAYMWFKLQIVLYRFDDKKSVLDL